MWHHQKDYQDRLVTEPQDMEICNLPDKRFYQVKILALLQKLVELQAQKDESVKSEKQYTTKMRNLTKR